MDTTKTASDREAALDRAHDIASAFLKSLPDTTGHESIPVAEANTLGIPVVGIMNSDCDFSQVMYPIVGNDASQDSVSYFLNEIANNYREGAKGNVTA